MTARAHSTTAEAAAQMPLTADHKHADPAPRAEAAAGVARRAWRQFGENPLQALFGAAIVALLVFSLTTTNSRIDDTNDRITRLEARMDARLTALEEAVAEINLKLTALIASLNRTDEVNAALEGRIIDSAQVPHPADSAPG